MKGHQTGELLVDLFNAVEKLRNDWAEGDEAVRRHLWRRLGDAADNLRYHCGTGTTSDVHAHLLVLDIEDPEHTYISERRPSAVVR